MIASPYFLQDLGSGGTRLITDGAIELLGSCTYMYIYNKFLNALLDMIEAHSASIW